MSSKVFDKNTDILIDAFLSLETKEDCKNFLADLCTVTEIKSLSQRLEVAKLLSCGEAYSEIEKKTGASSATVSRVNRALNYGSDGYTNILRKLGDKNE